MPHAAQNSAACTLAKYGHQMWSSPVHGQGTAASVLVAMYLHSFTLALITQGHRVRWVNVAAVAQLAWQTLRATDTQFRRQHLFAFQHHRQDNS